MKSRACLVPIVGTLLLLVFSLAGCATTPPVQYYTLSNLSEMHQDVPESAESDTIAIGIGPVEFPKFLDRPQIVTRKSPNRIQVSEFHRWADSLPIAFSRVLAKNISILLPGDRVAVYPWEDQFVPTFRIRLNVEQFDGRFGGHVLLKVNWSVASQEGSDEPVVKNTLIEEPLPADGYEALVAAESRALAALSRAIVDEIVQLRSY